MGQGPQKPDHRGNFFMVPRMLQDSVAWRCSSLRARVVLNVFLARHNGFNNGKIALGIREIGKAIGDQNHGGNSRAVAELIEHGFLECTSTVDHQQSKTREYRITFISTGEAKRTAPATNEYLDWRPAKQRMRQFGGARTATSNPVSVAATASQRQFSVAETTTRSTVIRGFEADCFDAVTASLLDNHSSVESSLSPNSTSAGVASLTSRAPQSITVPLEELRQWTRDSVEHLGFGGQRQLAADAGVPDSIVCRFRQGRSIPASHRLPLQSACGRVLPYRRWKEAAA